jgi:hypothetical protein
MLPLRSETRFGPQFIGSQSQSQYRTPEDVDKSETREDIDMHPRTRLRENRPVSRDNYGSSRLRT